MGIKGYLYWSEKGIRRVSFSITEWTGDLASRLDYVASPSRELTEWPVWTFCLVVLQLAWQFSFSTCFTRVHHLATCQSQATREIQSRVLASLHILENFFILSYTLLLHDSHLNLGFLNAEIQANWHGIMPTKWLIKFNLTSMYIYMLATVTVYIYTVSVARPYIID